jgi:hypothetical protein
MVWGEMLQEENVSINIRIPDPQEGANLYKNASYIPCAHGVARPPPLLYKPQSSLSLSSFFLTELRNIYIFLRGTGASNSV